MSLVPLSPIDGNSRLGKELTPYIHRKIDGKHKSDYRLAEIAHDLYIPENTVQNTLNLFFKHNNRESLSQSGCSKSVSRHDE